MTTPRKGKKAAPKPDLERDLESLAAAVVQEALKDNPPLTEKISALRAGSAYYAMTRKLPPPEGEKASGFNGYRDALRNSLASDARGGRTDGTASFVDPPGLEPL